MQIKQAFFNYLKTKKMKKRIINTLLAFGFFNLMFLPFPLLISILIFGSFEAFLQALEQTEKGMRILLIIAALFYELVILFSCSTFESVKK